MTRLDRRSLLKLAGGLLATGALGGCDLLEQPILRERGAPLPGRIDHVPSVCLQCPGACGILVQRVDGVPMKIRGNPDHPMNRGGLCPKGVAGLQALYDPDRIKGPMRRVGSRGAGRWAPVPWAEAIGTVARRLAAIRSDPGPQAVAFLGDRYQGTMEPLVRRFLRSYGSPNHLCGDPGGPEVTNLALEMTQGVHDTPAFDWGQTNYVIAFGASWLESYRATTHMLRAYAHLRRGRPGMRAKLVHVDPRFGLTSAKADEWVPIRPGTDAALALGIAHVLIQEALYDAEFVAEHTFGFEDWTDDSGSHKGFRRHVLDGYPPGRVEEITGVPQDRVVGLAEEFASRRPSVALAERGVGTQGDGLYARMAIHALNALVGSINRTGGVLIQQEAPLRPFAEASLDETARRGLAHPRVDGAGTRRYPLSRTADQALPAAVASGAPYAIEALFLYDANPVFSRPNGAGFRRALERIPFVVSFSPFLDESTRLADWVLPDHTFLERWQDVPVPASVGHPVVGVRRPVTEPLYDTRNTGDVLLDLAHALGGSVSEAFPWKDFHEVLSYRLGGLAKIEGASVPASSEEGFVRKVEAAGGWWIERERLRPWEEVFRTPSGRFEFYATGIRSRLDAVLGSGEDRAALLAELGVVARGDEAFLPHYEPARVHGDADEFPFRLVAYETMALAAGHGANQPWLQEIAGVQLGERWGTWVEINPRTARRLGIGDGDVVRVDSPRGHSLHVRARHHAGTHPEILCMPFGQGHTACGHWAAGTGVNPNDILVMEEDRLSGQVAHLGTRVKVERV